MCPVCLATAALIAGSIATTGGLTAIVLKKVVTNKAAHNTSTITPPTEDRHG